MKSTRWIAGAAVVLAATGAGTVIERAVDHDADRVRALTAEVDRLAGREELLELERARLRAERNRLEARLAASREAPICPRRYVSTADAAVAAPYTFEYPCSWHVLHDRVERIEAAEREGLQVSITLVSQFPIALVPREGPLTEIEVADWSSAGERDDLPTIAEWVAAEIATFTEEPDTSRFEAGGGVTVTRLTGTKELFEQPFGALVLVWEYLDPFSGARHIVQATAFNPGPPVRAAMDRLARTFAVREG